MRRKPPYIPESYDLFLRRKWLALTALLGAVAVLALLSLTTGSSGLSLGQVLATFAGQGTD